MFLLQVKLLINLHFYDSRETVSSTSRFRNIRGFIS